MEVIAIPALADNYIWLVQHEQQALVVDPGAAEPILATLDERQLTPAAVLITHHHHDHTGGLQALLQRYGDVPVYGPRSEAIRGVTHPVAGGDTLSLAHFGQWQVFSTPGHTQGHLAFYDGERLFCGDTLFAAGCGRLLEGTPEQMYQSLQILNGLPEATSIYCGHEYTSSNLRFAAKVEPDSDAIGQRLQAVADLRSRNAPTLPSTLALERKTNPFLRTHEAAVVAAASRFANQQLSDPAEVFRALRQWKDQS